MSLKIIQTQNAPAAIGPYSQAIVTGGMLLTSGQLGIDPLTNALPEGIEAQTRQSLLNIRAILEEAALEVTDVIKTTVFVKNMADFPVVNEIYASFFGDHKPARSCVEVSQLPKSGLIEIEVIAQYNKDSDGK
ncbi:MAG: RidA family protein [Clostridia bacterium]|nr:RidA family protein [Oscillospiraceae bacterium]MBP5727524.1 RidA family protein [Clostridia bacterium]